MRSQARTFFHIALGGILFLGLSVPLTWTLALASRLSVHWKEDPEHRRWTRRLFGLAIVDTVMLILVAAIIAPAAREEFEAVGGPVAIRSEAPRRAIGVILDPEAKEARVLELASGMPAEKAGVQQGDVIRGVNGEAAPDKATVQRLIRTSKGDGVALTIDRNGETLNLDVPLAEPIAVSRGLFEPETKTCPPLRHAQVPWGLLLVATASTALFVIGRRRGMNAALVWAAGALFGIAVIVEAIAWGTCQAVGGTTRGAFLLSLFAQTLLVLGTGVLLSRAAPKLEAPTPGGPWWKTSLLGGLYMFGGGLRVGLLLLAITHLLGSSPAGSPLQSSELGGLATSGLGPLGTGLFVLTVSVLGPIGEEWLFRGVVLPWLAAWMKPGWAIAISSALFAVLHLYYGLFVGVIFVYGMALGWARYQSGTLKSSIVLHVALNSLASAVLLIPR